MHSQEEPSTIRKLKRATKNIRSRLQKPAEVASASKEFFFGVTGGKFTSHSRFGFDLGKISKSFKNKISTIFGQADLEHLQLLKDEENNEDVQEVEEFPVSMETLYTNSGVTDGQLGRGVQITLDFETNKVRRRVDISEEENFDEDERDDGNSYTSKLQQKLAYIEEKYNKSSDEIADIFVKCSGDFDTIERYLEGETIVSWSYLEDLALTKSVDSMEYRCLISTKGKEEIERRKAFMMQTTQYNI